MEHDCKSHSKPSKLSVLLFPLEFSTWQKARHWTYAAQLGFEEGFIANDVEFFTIPVLAEVPSTSAASWLYYARQLCKERQFDQAWIWLVHPKYDETFLNWLADIAPIRVGFLMESIEYSQRELQENSYLKGRKELIENQIRYMTHILAGDEADAERINKQGICKALWFPSMVPERFLAGSAMIGNGKAVFCGLVHSERAKWLNHPDLHDLLVNAVSKENFTGYPQLFDKLNLEAINFLQQNREANETFLLNYLSDLRHIRQECFKLWLNSLQEGCAVVNLPHLFKSYAGRVVEAMAAGRPVISWQIPDRPRTKALFQDSKEILLFDPSHPGQLANHIRHIQNNPDFAWRMAENALQKVRKYHTAEKRIQQVLLWINTGTEPDFGEIEQPIQSQQNSQADLLAGTRAYRKGGGGDVATTKSYFIKKEYRCNLDANGQANPYLDDIQHSFSFQAAVYRFAAEVIKEKRLTNVLDIGCGLGVKLSKYIYPVCHDITGIDLEYAIEFCKKVHHFGKWLADNIENPSQPLNRKFDLIISADVVEHLVNPDELFEYIKSYSHPGTMVVLSTPERDITRGKDSLGPPANRTHIREWNMAEFHKYIHSRGFTVVKSFLFKEKDDAAIENCQVLLCKPGVHQMENSIPWKPSKVPFELHEVCNKQNSANVTIVTVNFNTLEFIKLCISKVFELSDLPFEMIVVDNGSTDGSLEYLRSEKRIRLLELPRNIGHGPALDYAMKHVTTKYVVVMDSDAHPIHKKWLSKLIELLNNEVLVSGVYVHRNYVHPSCMAMEAETFRKYNLTFRPNWPPDNDIKKLGVTHWDVGEYISMEILRNGKKLHYFKLSNKPLKSIIGSEYGGIVYHHFFASRIIAEPNRVTFDGVTRQDIVSAADNHLAAQNQNHLVKLSVVLTTYNRPELLESTLAGFANQTARREDFEVIVVDDGSEPPVKEVVEKFSSRINTVYLYQQNSGLAAARNNGIRTAKGQIVLFSDDDDMPGPELIAQHLRSHQENPDERVTVLGHLDWHKDLQVTPLMYYVTHVGGEYFGYDRLHDGQFYDVWKWWGGLISAKLSLLRSVEGPFDSQLRFGYEDTELACRLRDSGVKVLYNARARSFILRSIDFESFCKRRYIQGQALYRVASLHPEIIVPRYQLHNAADLYYSKYAPFLDEWSRKVVRFEALLNSESRLQRPDIDKYLRSLYIVYQQCFIGYWLKGYIEQFENSKFEIRNSKFPPAAGRPLRIAMVSTNTPGFDIGSSNLRIYHILKILASSGHKIDYLYFSPCRDDGRYRAAFDGAINFIKVLGTINGFSDYLHFNKVEKLDCVWITNLWMVDYLDFAVQLTQWLKHHHPQTMVFIDTMDFHYKKFMRKFNVSRDDSDLLKANRFLEVEKKLYPLADVVLTVTEVEKRDILETIGSDCNVSVIPNIHRISAQEPNLQQREHICFLGSFHISHNADAVKWFLKEVWPLIVEKAPQVKFHILGFDNEKFRHEIEVSPNVKVIGYVEDAESAVANYRLFVCPMTYGAGMKGKLGIAAAAGTPIVTTTIGAEGFDFVDGQDCFIADEPQSFAERCLRLLREDSLWSQFSTKAKAMVAEKFSIEATSERIQALLQQVRESCIVIGESSHQSPITSHQSPAAPKVSIITSCYNSGKFLPECIESIRNQTMDQWELFLLDDGSTDDTRGIIEQYCRMDERIKPYYFQSNEGPYVRRNFAIERANSDFIIIQDADDIMSPAKLEILYSEITKDKRLAVVGSFYRVFLEEFRALQYTDACELPLEHDEITAEISSGGHAMSHMSAIIRKEMFETVGLYDKNPFGSDTFWFAKLAEYACHCPDVRFKNVPGYLTLKRVHTSNQTQLLPTFDPRNRRIRYHQYCECKLRRIRQKLQTSSDTNVAAELRNCDCSDFLERFKNHIIRWESESVDEKVIQEVLRISILLFNRCFYVSCVAMLNGIEVMVPDVAKRFKNYDLLRAMALFALSMETQSLVYLDREIQTHKTAAAQHFVSDYFEKRFTTDVQKWCAENGDLYDLQMIDTETPHQLSGRGSSELIRLGL